MTGSPKLRVPHRDDGRLHLVRFEVPNSGVIYWLMLKDARDARKMVEFHLSAGFSPGRIKSDMHTAKATAVALEDVADRRVYMSGARSGSLFQACMHEWGYSVGARRGNPRIVGFEHTDRATAGNAT